MSGGGPRGPGSLSATQAEEMDRACDRFEGEWRAGARPDLAAYLAGPSGPVRAALVRELIAVDVAWRKRAGERPAAEDYLRPFPSDADAVLAAFETVGRHAVGRPGARCGRRHGGTLNRQDGPPAGYPVRAGRLALRGLHRRMAAVPAPEHPVVPRAGGRRREGDLAPQLAPV